MQPSLEGPVHYGTPKQCYHAVTQTVKSYLFLGSSPSVARRSGIVLVCRQDDRHYPFLNISVIYKGSFTWVPWPSGFINHPALPNCFVILIRLVCSAVSPAPERGRFNDIIPLPPRCDPPAERFYWKNFLLNKKAQTQFPASGTNL